METGVSRKIILRVWASGTTALVFLDFEQDQWNPAS